jgi:hypothetical protein
MQGFNYQFLTKDPGFTLTTLMMSQILVLVSAAALYYYKKQLFYMEERGYLSFEQSSVKSLGYLLILYNNPLMIISVVW